MSQSVLHTSKKSNIRNVKFIKKYVLIIFGKIVKYSKSIIIKVKSCKESEYQKD
jgi:hypothetical protein